MKKLGRWIVGIIYLMILALIAGGIYAATGGDNGFVRTVLLFGIVFTYYATRNKVLNAIGLTLAPAPPTAK